MTRGTSLPSGSAASQRTTHKARVSLLQRVAHCSSAWQLKVQT